MSATKYVKSYASVHKRENLFLFFALSGSTSFHFGLASTKCGSHPSHPLTRVYIYIATLHVSGSVLSHCELGGGGEGKGATRQPGVVHILGLLVIITIQRNSNK